MYFFTSSNIIAKALIDNIKEIGITVDPLLNVHTGTGDCNSGRVLTPSV